MCGICGIVGPATEGRAWVVRQMCAAIAHRGPDAEGIHEDQRAALGMRRLAVIDVATGDQPVFDESGTVVAVFNGEIYNFRQLRERLIGNGHVLRGSSDSECIPHLYEEHGVDFVRHLRGMFAIALWDRRRSRLVLARDRLGKKPLYYRVDPKGLAFASELKALLTDPATDRTVDEEAVSHYLTYQYVPAPHSVLASVRKLEPAHVLVYEDGRHTTSRYWRLDYRPKDARRAVPDEDALAEQLRHRLVDCVRTRLISERPLGAFLSGGLDSSAIVAAMSQVAEGPVKTFSIGFEDEAYNELPFARRVAELYGTDHHELVVRPDVLEILPRLARSFDEPFADSSAIPSYYLAEMARQHVVVALNGDGGDEAFGGYPRYPAFLRTTARRIPSGVARALGGMGRTIRPWGARSHFLRRASYATTLLAASQPADRYARFLSYFLPEQKETLFTADFAARIAGADSHALVREVWDAHAATDDVNRLLAVDSHTYLPGDLLPKVDITTMAVSLEARSPFLDHTLVEWAASLPGDLKVRGSTTKHLFKKALEPWLPQDLIHRRKMGFGVPLGDWLRGPLRTVVHDLLTDATASDRGWFRPEAVRRLIAEHMAGQDHAVRLYALVMLEMWRREVVDVTLKVDA
jgi:asparagine synthase (glutamine-hydrolysing)